MPWWALIGLAVLTGVGMAGVGMNVMHDALHGATSRHPWVNELLGGSIYLLGSDAFVWKFLHNEAHHTHTNVLPEDQADALRELYAILPSDYLDTEQRVDVFVDGDGLLRRVQVASPGPDVSGVSVPDSTTILDYFDFGVDVAVEAPAGCDPASSSPLGLGGDLPS